MEGEPTEDRMSQKAWNLVANIDIKLRGFHARILEALRDREKEFENVPPEDRLWEEAAKILWDLSRDVGWYSDAGLFPENLTKYVADDMKFLGLAQHHEVPLAFLADVARDIVAMHAQVLNVLHGGEWDYEDEGS